MRAPVSLSTSVPNLHTGFVQISFVFLWNVIFTNDIYFVFQLLLSFIIHSVVLLYIAFRRRHDRSTLHLWADVAVTTFHVVFLYSYFHSNYPLLYVTWISSYCFYVLYISMLYMRIWHDMHLCLFFVLTSVTACFRKLSRVFNIRHFYLDIHPSTYCLNDPFATVILLLKWHIETLSWFFLSHYLCSLCFFFQYPFIVSLTCTHYSVFPN
jgi:hypothetical protein